jgi:hypothetical protein
MTRVEFCLRMSHTTYDVGWSLICTMFYSINLFTRSDATTISLDSIVFCSIFLLEWEDLLFVFNLDIVDNDFNFEFHLCFIKSEK